MQPPTAAHARKRRPPRRPAQRDAAHRAAPLPLPLLLFPLLLLQACVYVPRTTEVYDAGCGIVARRMALEPVQIGGLFGCRNADCAVLLVVYGATAAASVVVSGSIVVAGNVAYWFERQGQCRKEN